MHVEFSLSRGVFQCSVVSSLCLWCFLF